MENSENGPNQTSADPAYLFLSFIGYQLMTFRCFIVGYYRMDVMKTLKIDKNTVMLPLKINYVPRAKSFFPIIERRVFITFTFLFCE